MKRNLVLGVVGGLSLLVGRTLFAQEWTVPTPEELALTSVPEVPGAAGVYLYKEEKEDDVAHTKSFYTRLKVLTERGKEYANVELPYLASEQGYSVDSVEGRTIHPDGTIIPFSGKPYDKLLAKGGNLKVKAKVFTLPAVEVGSILEYRYKIHTDDRTFYDPDWYIQTDLLVRKAHYMFRPTTHELVDAKGNSTNGTVAWAPILPKGVTVKVGSNMLSKGSEMSLDISNVMPLPNEEDMPPVNSLSYRVLFYYTAFKTADEFWHQMGKSWSKEIDKFVGPGSAVKDYTATVVGAGDTPQGKVDKIYAAVMKMENTEWTRTRSSKEEHADGLREVKNAGDIVQRKRGSPREITLTFVAMARAAGLKAYVMGVANRKDRIFVPMYLNLRQLDDSIAIVNIDGKDVFYDPGERFCEPGHLVWAHSFAGGLRQTDDGTKLISTPGEEYKFNHIQRIADLALDDHGVGTGTVTVTYTGDAALQWRQQALRGDDTSLNEDLRTHMEQSLPGGAEVRVTNVENLADYTKPLKITYEVKGAVGVPTGKRLLVPADLFEVNAKPRFSASKRQIAVDLHYASYTQDAVRLKLPASLVVESVPESDHGAFEKLANYETFSNRTPTSITSFRNMGVGTPVFLSTEYPNLRSFFAKLDSKDQESIVLTRPAAVAAGSPGEKSPGN